MVCMEPGVRGIAASDHTLASGFDEPDVLEGIWERSGFVGGVEGHVLRPQNLAAHR